MARQKTENTEYDALKAALRQNAPENFYIFYGEEPYLRDYYLEMLRKKTVSGPAETFNFHRLDGKDLDLNALAGALEALPMMSEHTLTVVEEYDLFRAPESERSQLLAMLSDLPETTIVVFLYDTVAYKPDGRQKKLTALIKEKAHVVEFRKQTQRALTDWIAKHFRAAGKEISPEDAAYLVFQTGGAMTTLSSEIEKLSAYVSGNRVTRTDINMVVEPVLDAVAFQISDAIGAGDYDRALERLHTVLLMQQEPVVILGAIGTQLRRLHMAKVLQEQGKSTDYLVQLAGVSDYAARLAMKAARDVPMRWCVLAVDRCAETDYRLKSSYDEPERLLELLLVELAEARRHG